jgi:hypothetical protein
MGGPAFESNCQRIVADIIIGAEIDNRNKAIDCESVGYSRIRITSNISGTYSKAAVIGGYIGNRPVVLPLAFNIASVIIWDRAEDLCPVVSAVGSEIYIE